MLPPPRWILPPLLIAAGPIDIQVPGAHVQEGARGERPREIFQGQGMTIDVEGGDAIYLESVFPGAVAGQIDRAGAVAATGQG